MSMGARFKRWRPLRCAGREAGYEMLATPNPAHLPL